MKVYAVSRWSEDTLTHMEISNTISVLTSPPRSAGRSVIHSFRHPKKLIKHSFIRDLNLATNWLEGHPAVTRSMLSGFLDLKTPFHFNPLKKNVTDICIVLSSFEALAAALELKQKGIIKKLIAGPNIATYPDEENSILTHKEIDICLVPSNWVKEMYEEISPSLKRRIKIWPAGVNQTYWSPKYNAVPSKTENILIYIKGSHNKVLLEGINILLKKNRFNTVEIEYGSYSQKTYKNLLNWANLVIVIGGTESQGIAMAEAWSMNVPTLVLANEMWIRPGGAKFVSSSSPYLSPATGIFFTNLKDLMSDLEEWHERRLKYNPRAWILKNMTDTLCGQKLLNLMR